MHADETPVLASGGRSRHGAEGHAEGGGDRSGRNDGVAVTRGATGERLAFGSGPVVDLFQRFAVLDQGSEAKRVTPEVFDLDRPTLAALLRGLFTADGTVANYGEKSQYVALDSSSEELLHQVQLLLLSFGIKSKLYGNRRGEAVVSLLPDGHGGMREYPVLPMFSLRVSRSSRVLFEREIGFHPASPKAAALARLNAEVAAYRDELTDQVATIEPAGEADVFDLTEEATHHFVAAGLVVHNCSEYMFLDDTACNLASINVVKFRGGAVRRRGLPARLPAVDDGARDQCADGRVPERGDRAEELGLPHAGPGLRQHGHAAHARGHPLRLPRGRLDLRRHHRGDDGRGLRDLGGAGAGPRPVPGLRAQPREHAARDAQPPARRPQRPAGEYEGLTIAPLGIDPRHCPTSLAQSARDVWDRALALGEAHGYRNAQVTVLAPTGTSASSWTATRPGSSPTSPS